MTHNLLRPDDRRVTPLLILDQTLCLCFSRSVYQLSLCLTQPQHKSLTPTAHVGKLNSITATGQSYVISMQLKMTSLTKSPKSIFSIVITMYPSTVQLLVKLFSTTPSLKLLDYLTANTCRMPVSYTHLTLPTTSRV